MNTPLPSAVPSANVTLKEDVSSSGGSSGNVFKTTTGEVCVSLSPPETLNSASVQSLNQLAFSQIFVNTETSQFLNESNSHDLIFLSPELIEIEIQLAELLQTLENIETRESSTNPLSQTKTPDQPRSSSPSLSNTNISRSPKEETKTSTQKSLSSLAKSPKLSPTTSHTPTTSTSLKQTSGLFKTPAPQLQRTQKESEQESTRLSHLSTLLAEKKHEAISTTKSQESQQNHENKEQKHRQEQQKEQQKEKQEDQEKDEHHKKSSSRPQVENNQDNSLNISVMHLRYASDIRQSPKETQKEVEKTFRKKAPSPMSLFTSTPSSSLGFQPIQTPKIENVFISFMQLMARILGQAEAEAHELYLRVKERTDNVDKLTLLLSKINAEKGAINWEKDTEMKALVDQVKKLGVTIDNTTYCWSEEEKKLLKENIQMRKENMEKITQLERTDMQRHLQEVSQCHQARSNVLKLLKELMDTFIYNLRP